MTSKDEKPGKTLTLSGRGQSEKSDASDGAKDAAKSGTPQVRAKSTPTIRKPSAKSTPSITVGTRRKPAPSGPERSSGSPRAVISPNLKTGGTIKPEPIASSEPPSISIRKDQPSAPAAVQPPKAGDTSDVKLTNNERETRMRVLEQARVEDEKKREQAAVVAEEAKAADERARVEAEAESKRKAEAEMIANAAAEDDARQAEEGKIRKEAEDKARKLLEEEERQRKAKQQAKVSPQAPAAPKEEDTSDRVDTLAGGRIKRAKSKQPIQNRDSKKGQERRRTSSKMTVTKALEDDADRMRSLASIKRRREKEKADAQVARQEGRKVVRDVTIPDTITVQELANRMAERGSDVVRGLMKNGVMATINQTIDADTAELIVEEFGHRVVRVSDDDAERSMLQAEDQEGEQTSRPPVVTIMGHVDHGKTSLLDALRKTDVVKGEAGGITQHIGAYQVTVPSGDKITFVDTPGHAAFTEMRARGANVTDIIILVVAADDSVMPQTIEAIAHAKAAEAPIIIAVNKIDRPEADPQRVINDLLQHEIVTEEFGGDVMAVPVSAIRGDGLDKLQEAILLQAELLELKANAERRAEGVVVEAKMEKGRGPVATALIQRGTLKVGDVFVSGQEWGKVRAMINDEGKQMKATGPAMPAEILGLNGVPMAGDDIVVVESESKAREIAELRVNRAQEKKQAQVQRSTLDQMFSAIKEGEVSELAVVIKADVQGSVEAIVGALDKMANDEVSVRVLHTGVGAITESDIVLSKASNALVLGFNVRANKQARDAAKSDGIDIRYFSIIYELLDDVKGLLSGLLKPEMRERFLGYAEIRELFNITKTGKVAGCFISEGLVQRGAGVRLLRDNVVIHEGKLKTLRRFKEEVKDVKAGFECGMAFENYQDIQVGDQIEAFEVEEIARTLD